MNQATYPDLDVTVEGHVATIEIRRPPNNFFDTGFGDLSAFNARFRRVFGMNPGRFRGSQKDGVVRTRRASA